MPDFFAPASTLVPYDGASDTKVGRFGLIRRRWGVSIFDWAEIQSKHKTEIPYTIADRLLQSCNLEFVTEGPTIEAATEALSALHLMLYLNKVHPFAIQMLTNYSINEFSGVCSRKTRRGMEMLPADQQRGIVSDEVSIQVWRCPYPSGSHTRSAALHREITHEIFEHAVADAEKWIQLKREVRQCSSLERVTLTAPTLPAVDQSLLHIWTGLESIFPGVQTEVSFRLAMYIAQMTRDRQPRLETYSQARRSYGDRSKVAHGRLGKESGVEAWNLAWLLLIRCLRSILDRHAIPTEEELIGELLGD